MAQTHLPAFWKEKLLSVVGGKHNIENNRFLDAQAQAEGGTAKWNPLNSTLKLPGSTPYNSIPVQNYVGPVQGICATALVLTERDNTGVLVYGGILGDLQAGIKTAEQIVNDNWNEVAHWGTDPQLVLDVLKQV